MAVVPSGTRNPILIERDLGSISLISLLYWGPLLQWQSTRAYAFVCTVVLHQWLQCVLSASAPKRRFPHRQQILPSATSSSCTSLISVKVINSTTGILLYLEYCGELNLVVKIETPLRCQYCACETSGPDFLIEEYHPSICTSWTCLNNLCSTSFFFQSLPWQFSQFPQNQISSIICT